ncbi:MAG TPA: EboA domain-containing protein [Vicinamibacterales bacterium]|nr:EboA domain-containing protein [Vicinamibacterales bacterium]
MLTVVERVLAASLRAAASLEGPLQDAYARAPLRVGRGPLNLTADQLRELHAAFPGVGFERWTREDAARALLLIAHRNNGVTGSAFVTAALECFEQGDAREQQSWLRAIALWPEGDAFLPHAIDACRTNIVPVFEALACENPYPAAHFPDRNFNQVVLKAMFNNIALSRIVGLNARLNTELTRMARDYAAERTAAGRSVPADIDLVIL